MCKQDVTLKDQQWLTCHKTKPNNGSNVLNFSIDT